MGDRTGDLHGLIARMESDLAGLHDARRLFHATYLRTTRAVAERIDRGGFDDAAWVRRWDLAFARLYLDALDADRRGDPVPGPWRVAFDAARWHVTGSGAARSRPEITPLQHVLVGMNAHINYDLPQALLAVIAPADFDRPEVVRSRRQDHRRIDTILQGRVAAEGAELTAHSALTVIDRALKPANRVASRRLLAEARDKVWRNTLVLDRARRNGGPALATSLAELEDLCERRVRDLIRPGFVLLRLARRGFGVLLRGA